MIEYPERTVIRVILQYVTRARKQKISLQSSDFRIRVPLGRPLRLRGSLADQQLSEDEQMLAQLILKLQMPFLKAPIFVTGCGHSGTSIMIRVLGSHSKIYAIQGETGTFLTGRWRLSDELRIIRNVSKFNLSSFMHHKPRWVEKTPRHVLEIGKILGYLPTARIIVMIRDGRDVACSLKERTGSIDGGVKRWLRDNGAAMPFFGHPQVRAVKYEEFAKSPEAVMRGVLDFLEEEFEPNIFATDKTAWEPVHAAPDEHVCRRVQQLRKPIYDGSGRWRKEMTAQERALFKKMAQEMMVELGYDVNDSCGNRCAPTSLSVATAGPRR
ncbi:MAG: sulfotransferase [bacterium]